MSYLYANSGSDVNTNNAVEMIFRQIIRNVISIQYKILMLKLCVHIKDITSMNMYADYDK